MDNSTLDECSCSYIHINMYGKGEEQKKERKRREKRENGGPVDLKFHGLPSPHP